jgi:hypothetical protein
MTGTCRTDAFAGKLLPIGRDSPTRTMLQS